MEMNKQGGLMDMPVNLLLLFIVITLLVALIPAFADMIEMAQWSTSLNCPGYVYNGNASDPLSYNASLSSRTSTIGCLAIKLYLPYIVLGVLIAGVALILYGRSSIGSAPEPGYG